MCFNSYSFYIRTGYGISVVSCIQLYSKRCLLSAEQKKTGVFKVSVFFKSCRYFCIDNCDAGDYYRNFMDDNTRPCGKYNEDNKDSSFEYGRAESMAGCQTYQYAGSKECTGRMDK